MPGGGATPGTARNWRSGADALWIGGCACGADAPSRSQKQQNATRLVGKKHGLSLAAVADTPVAPSATPDTSEAASPSAAHRGVPAPA